MSQHSEKGQLRVYFGTHSVLRSQTPLTPPGVALMGMLTAKLGLPADQAPTTFGGAYELLQSAKGMFSV